MARELSLPKVIHLVPVKLSELIIFIFLNYECFFRQLMQRKQELMTSLREMRRGAEGLLANKRSREKELRARIEHLETSRPASNATKAQRILDSKNDIAEIENSIAKKEANLTQYENEYSEVISKLKDLNKRKEELTKETFASFCLKNNIDNLQFVFST